MVCMVTVIGSGLTVMTKLFATRKSIYSRLSLIRFSGGKIIYSNYREIRIIESRCNSNYRLKLAKNRITEGN